MSGFEVAGVVLALLPLAVKAAQTYADILSAHKTASFELKKLIQDLETEEACLRNTCELLLTGVAPRNAVDKLVEAPFGPEWEPFNKQMRLRLWHTHDSFSKHIKEMLEATKELHGKLCVTADGEPSFMDPIAIVRELKKKSAFTIKKRDYDVVLDRIKAANLVLERLVTQSRQLEPDRKHRSQARVTRLVRELARGLFGALRRVSTCGCVPNAQAHKAHNACLELRPRNEVVLLPDDTDDAAAQMLDFHLVLELHDIPAPVPPTSQTPSRLDSIDVRVIGVDHWESDDAPSTRQEYCAVPTKPSLHSKLPRETQKFFSKTVRWSQGVRFKAERKPTISITQTALNSPPRIIVNQTVTPGRTAPRAISNLCQDVVEQYRTAAVECYGYIVDDPDGRKFGLYPRLLQPKYQPSHPGVISLRQILDDGWQTFQPLSFLDKFEVGLALSVGILHLYGTPWLRRVITLDDIVFIYDGTARENRSKPLLYRPFVFGKLLVDKLVDPSLAVSTADAKTEFHVANHVILSLGVILIQVMIGKAVKTLSLTENMDVSAVVSKCAIGTELLGQVRGSGGTNYEMAVNWCLGNAFKVANLTNDKFCNEYYAEVVARLEEDLQLLADD